MKKRILVIDVGGTNVKMMISRAKRRKFKSGPKMTPREMVGQIKLELQDWKYDAISIGFPAPVRDGRILLEPKHLGKGWMRFDFEKAFRKPVRIVNDAALQALGSYRGGRMLFLDSARVSVRLWFCVTRFFHLNSAISRIVRLSRSKIFWESSDLRSWAKKHGSAIRCRQLRSLRNRSSPIMWSWAVAMRKN